MADSRETDRAAVEGWFEATRQLLFDVQPPRVDAAYLVRRAVVLDRFKAATRAVALAARRQGVDARCFAEALGAVGLTASGAPVWHGGDVWARLDGCHAVAVEIELAVEASTTSADPTDAAGAAEVVEPSGQRRPSVNDRMKAELAANLEAVKGWTAQKWASHLGCSKSTVIGCPTWKSLALLRQQAKAERRADRRRRRKASSR